MSVVYVLNGRIKSKKIGSLFLLWNLAFCFWTLFITIKYFELRQETINKENTIIELNETKQTLLSNLSIFKRDIDNIRYFVLSLNKYDRFASVDNVHPVDCHEGLDVSNVKVALGRVRKDMINIDKALSNRIGNLEAIRDTLNIGNANKTSSNVVFKLDNNIANKDIAESIVISKNLSDHVRYIQDLELLLNEVPLYPPMKGLTISSNFGKRLDPFTNTIVFHNGIDLVSSHSANVYATADGVVIAARNDGHGYGNTVVILHKHNIKTTYAHLNKRFVSIGDKVGRGDVIGTQGSSGRATGEHLHYEISKNGKRYDPFNFIKMGSYLY